MKRAKVYVVRVVVDPSDATKDFFLPEAYAQEEFDAGRLGQVQMGRAWIYHDPREIYWEARIRDKGLR